MKTHKKFDLWTGISLFLAALFLLFLIYPMFGILKQSVVNPGGHFTLEYFRKFFAESYYSTTIINSFKISIMTTLVTLLIGIPFSYFYSFYRLKGAKVLFVVSLLCSMSAPFIGAYSWIMLMGRNGVITKFLATYLHIRIGSIYGFSGILLVLTLKLYPLVFIYMNGAFRNIDSTLMEASANLGCTGLRRFFDITIKLSMPTVLAAALLVFMRAFADFGTPLLIGEGYRTLPVEIYNQYLGENGQDHNFAAAVSVVAIAVTALIFFIQKIATSHYKFSINALHPIEKKKPHGIGGILMHVYCYLIIIAGFAPNLYICYLSFRNCSGSIFKPGYSLGNYREAAKNLLGRAIGNTLLQGVLALAIIIVLAVLIAYLVVRRSNVLNNAIDTCSMLPYIMPGSVIGIMLVIAFGSKPFLLTGTMTIMLLNFVIRRMPYTIRSAIARLIQIPMSIEEAAISLGASKVKTFIKVTVPMMSSGIISGAILSWVAIVTELSGSIILYNNKTINLTMATYVAISRGKDGRACAFAAILILITIISMVLFMVLSKSEDDITI